MARELIDRNQINYTWWERQDGTFTDGVTLQSIVERTPIVDAVEVIRCKDCEYTCPGTSGLVCTMWGAGTDTDGWCYKAERKNNEGKTD